MAAERPYCDDQFAETRADRDRRWRKIKARRIAGGKCWQCAKPIAECKCANINHAVIGPGCDHETALRQARDDALDEAAAELDRHGCFQTAETVRALKSKDAP